MNIRQLLNSAGSIRVAAHPTRPDANEIIIGDGQAGVTLARCVPDEVALLFARAYDTDGKARAMRTELELLSTDSEMPGQLRESVGVLLQSLYGDVNTACSAHGQYHPCDKCASEYRQEKRHADTGSPAVFVDTLPASLPHDRKLERELCHADNAARHARAMGWLPLTELPPEAPKYHEDGVRCVVVWVDLENPTDFAAQIAALSEIRRGAYSKECMADGWWRSLMDAPPAVEFAANNVESDA